MRKSCLFSQSNLFDYVYKQLSRIFAAGIESTAVLIVSELIRDWLFWFFQAGTCVCPTVCFLFKGLLTFGYRKTVQICLVAPPSSVTKHPIKIMVLLLKT